MFKLVQLLANFVVRQYEKEAQRLHSVVGKVDERRQQLLQEVDDLAQELSAEVTALERKFSARRAELLSELNDHDDAIDGHVATAAAATDKAVALSKLVK